MLPDRRIVVTGAGSGLGAEYAVAVARAGASVIVNDLDDAAAHRTAEAIRHAGGRAVPVAADVTDWAAAAMLIERCVDEFGGIDGLVNNAGIIGQVGAMTDGTPEAAEAVLRVNVLGTIYPSIHATRTMIDAGTPGAIVNVSSGNQSGHLGFATYGASKGAVSSLTYAWAVELEPHGIRVNAISPNANTAMVRDLETQLGSNPEARNYPSTQDNAAVVVFLLSEAATALRGQVVRVDSGLISLTSHPSVVSPRVPLQYSPSGVADVFAGPLRDRLQPNGIALSDITHLEQLY